MTEHSRGRERDLRLDDVEIGVAHAAGGDTDEHLAATRTRHRDPLDPKRLAGRREDGREHRPVRAVGRLRNRHAGSLEG
jgi:hypothetical protein